MIVDPGILFDGQIGAPMGVNSGISPSRVNPQQVSFAINTTFRSDYPQQRPGWKQVALTFKDATTQSRFEDGMFQNALYYESFGGDDAIIAHIGGRTFRILLTDNTVLEITPKKIDDTDDTNIPTAQKVWIQQAEQFVIIQNGRDAAIIFDGASCRRPNDALDEVPAGTVMAYALGRLWIAGPDRRSFIGSNLVFDPTTGTEAYNNSDSILRFEENTYLNEGGAFGVPQQAGIITAMAPVANLDTSLGQGPLQVFTERGSFSVNAPFDRTTWKDLTWPIQTVSSVTYGPKGEGTVVPVNGDLWYRAEDGVRTFQVARRDFNSWVNTPMSHEMDRVLAADDRALLRFGSGVVFDNRLLMTCAPQFSATYGTYHLGLAVLNFDGVSTILDRVPPNWEGVWTGLKIHKILKGNFNGSDRCLMLCRNDSNELELWELSLADPYDDEDKRVSWALELRSFQFRNSMELLSLEGADVWLDLVHGTVNLTMKYRPDQYPVWQSWHTYQACAQMENCASADCGAMYDLKAQHRARVMAPTPDDTNDASHGMPLRYGYEFQPRLEFVGACRLFKIRLRARKQPEYPFGSTST